ncbi:trans-sialidase, putative, partial [Trypanosoma cruzi marinkellei]
SHFYIGGDKKSEQSNVNVTVSKVLLYNRALEDVEPKTPTKADAVDTPEAEELAPESVPQTSYVSETFPPPVHETPVIREVYQYETPSLQGHDSPAQTPSLQRHDSPAQTSESESVLEFFQQASPVPDSPTSADAEKEGEEEKEEEEEVRSSDVIEPADVLAATPEPSTVPAVVERTDNVSGGADAAPNRLSTKSGKTAIPSERSADTTLEDLLLEHGYVTDLLAMAEFADSTVHGC